MTHTNQSDHEEDQREREGDEMSLHAECRRWQRFYGYWSWDPTLPTANLKRTSQITGPFTVRTDHLASLAATANLPALETTWSEARQPRRKSKSQSKRRGRCQLPPYIECPREVINWQGPPRAGAWIRHIILLQRQQPCSLYSEIPKVYCCQLPQVLKTPYSEKYILSALQPSLDTTCLHCSVILHINIGWQFDFYACHITSFGFRTWLLKKPWWLNSGSACWTWSWEMSWSSCYKTHTSEVSTLS